MKDAVGLRLGGHLVDYPKPWLLRYSIENGEKRPIKVYSHVWPSTGSSCGNGHHHADICEDDDYIWDESSQRWCQPYAVDYGKPNYEEYKVLKGRKEYNSDCILAADVRKWAESVFKEWGVTSETHEITWDLDEDDPNASVILAREMRKRAINCD